MMFKILIVGTVISTTLGITVPAEAQSLRDSEAVSESYTITPRKLIALARHGRFKNQGIPSHNNFGNGIRSGRITAKSLVQSAIESNRLPENALSDRDFLKAVDDHLKSGGCGSV